MEHNNWISKHNTVIRFGKYNVLDTIDGLATKTESITTIDLQTFYSIYLQLDCIVGVKYINDELVDISLTPHPLELLTHLLMKPQDYSIHYKRGSELLTTLATELNRTPASIYKSITILKNKKYLVKSEDSMLLLNDRFQNLKRKMNNIIAVNGHISYDFLFKFNVSN